MKTNSDTSHYLASSASRGKFILSRRGNERGQVAIFVALIFQVVFVFFALLINVGLLVHHKINLQHSTDLAAYYGAMKQAEQMNAIAHINFQMRQAWKLLTWRYRVLGTFGFIQKNGPASQRFPFNSETNPRLDLKFLGTQGITANRGNPTLNGQSDTNCSASGNQYRIPNESGFVGIQDIPFFCVGHAGFRSWPQAESNCQLQCSNFKGPSLIAALPTAPGGSIFGNSFANRALQFTNTANLNLQQQCDRLGPTGAQLLTKFLAAYAAESITRSETIKMLAANLSQDVGQMVDLDGASIREGSKRTFQNNLTGANFTGLQNNSFSAYNGLNANKCRFTTGMADNTNTEFLKKIDFEVLNFYIQNCTYDSTGSKYEPEPVYSAANGGLSSAFQGVPQDARNLVLSFLNPQSRISIGYEKNPNCIEYFAVKTTSEPNIPFLPLSKIRLEATAVAKPFGGSIGPAYGTSWGSNERASTYDDTNPLTKTDRALPFRTFNPSSSNPLIESIYTQPNFSLFVGDQLGLRNLDYLATYHSMLVMRDINFYDGKTYSNPNNSNQIRNGGSWPNFDNWENIDQLNTDLRPYDSLAKSDSGVAGTRAIEITAIAPNQFDVSYYSIEPDFYNNYYIKLFKNFNAIKQAAANNVNLTANQLRADFGAKGMDGALSFAPLDEKSFSVRDQILLKNKVLDSVPKKQPGHQIPGSDGNNRYSALLNYVLSYQTSLLTGWTFLHFNDYTTFPGQAISKSNANSITMSFGQCDDPWNKATAATDPTAESNFQSPMNEDADNPPVPGNCVTGGRTGYSVKLVSPSVMLKPNTMLNPMDPSFFNF